MTEIDAADAGAPQPQLIACELPMPGGCPNVMEYAGVGRKPKYCQQAVSHWRPSGAKWANSAAAPSVPNSASHATN